jgi:hypothetical protein
MILVPPASRYRHRQVRLPLDLNTNAIMSLTAAAALDAVPFLRQFPQVILNVYRIPAPGMADMDRLRQFTSVNQPPNRTRTQVKPHGDLFDRHELGDGHATRRFTVDQTLGNGVHRVVVVCANRICQFLHDGFVIVAVVIGGQPH